LIASFVLAVAVVALATALGTTSSQARAFDVDAASLSLARQLMEEVLARPFDPPAYGDHAGWKTGNHNKSQYDDIGDFDGFTDAAGFASNNGSGAAGGDLSFHRSVAFAHRATPGGADVADGDFGMITVTVTSDTRGTMPVTLDRLVCRAPLVR
jgi:Tfp pilus assembly protein PilV